MTTEGWLQLVTLALGLLSTATAAWRSRAKAAESQASTAHEEATSLRMGMAIARERAARAESRCDALEAEIAAANERVQRAEERALATAKELADLRKDNGAGGGAQGRSKSKRHPPTRVAPDHVSPPVSLSEDEAEQRRATAESRNYRGDHDHTGQGRKRKDTR